jgi:hypothetical protein
MRVDWDYIRPLYRAGQLSNVEITRLYSAVHAGQTVWAATVSEAAIRKQARKAGWARDLEPLVDEKTKAKLVREPVRKTADVEPRTDEQAAEDLAELRASVIRKHRVELEKLDLQIADVDRRLAEDEDLVEIGWFQGAATEHRVKMGLPTRMKLLEIKGRLVQIKQNLERQAWGIKRDDDQDGPLELVEVHQYLDGVKR